MRFALNDHLVDARPEAPGTTLLELLRTDLGQCGTKEGCASGDCGACTVLVSRARRDDDPAGDGPVYESVNACIAPAATVAGRHVVTVEGLAEGEVLHPAQRAMVDAHGSQCGFCTPGFVMSLAALHEARRGAATADPVDRETVVEAISGNLCRCTGYRPILDAAAAMGGCTDVARLADRAATPADAGDAVTGYHRPRTLAELEAILAATPDARLVAGGTDLMLESTQLWRDLGPLVDVREVDGLVHLEDADGEWRWGASASLARVRTFFADRLPPLATLLERYGSPQIRHRATLGGSLGTASPIGDLSPVLQVLGARLVLGAADGGRRELAVEDFHTDYRRTVLGAGEFVIEARMPALAEGERVWVRKFSKRFDDDISTVLGAACARADGSLRFAFGGVAATPLRVPALEQLAAADPQADLEAIRAVVDAELAPLTDVRGSADYRSALVAAFVAEVLADRSADGPATRVRTGASP